MGVKISTVVKQLPDFSRKTSEVMPFLDEWLAGQNERFIKKVKKIFKGANIDKRFSIMDPIEIFTRTSFEERNNIYKSAIKNLGEKVLVKALEKAAWKPTDLDFIITVSCTGFMIPSLDAFLINKLGLRQDIVRLPVTEMGCVAGVSGLIYAKNFLKNTVGKKAALITIECPTATFQIDDFSMTNIVSSAIFGDGAACALLASDDYPTGTTIIDEAMFHFPETEHLMGFDLHNSGLKMVLDVEVPATIANNFHKFIDPFLRRNSLTLQQIDHLIFHPGGKKIVQTIEALFADAGKNLEITKQILREYGNMSSATVLYILERFLEKEPLKGEKGLLLSFGPGLTAQMMLIEF